MNLISVHFSEKVSIGKTLIKHELPFSTQVTLTKNVPYSGITRTGDVGITGDINFTSRSLHAFLPKSY